jgi:hypothetical protein
LWPKRLETFSLSGISWNSVPSNWDWETIWLLLIPHRSSLRHLTIGPLRRNEAQVIDFTQFTQLAYLELSMYDINSTPREAVSRLLAAPKLSSLTFSYTVEDQHPEQWSSFDEKQAEWIR